MNNFFNIFTYGYALASTTKNTIFYFNVTLIENEKYFDCCEVDLNNRCIKFEIFNINYNDTIIIIPFDIKIGFKSNFLLHST